MFGLLGPNGAGKTTLMRIMTLLQAASSGTVLYDDYDITRDRKEIRALLGYLPQDFRFFEKLKTWEFLDYGASLAGIRGKRQRAAVVDEMLTKVGLFEARDRWANRLSGGMKRRLGIAQALIGQPKVIIVDEPTTGLDPEERIRFRNILSEVSDKDAIIILSTHIVGDISSTCKKLALLNRGELKFEGSPDEMIALARGKVWEIFVTDHEYEEIKERYPIISTIPMDGGMEIQVVAESVEGYSCKAIDPNLEHAYVYYMDYLLKDKLNMQADAIRETALFQ
jgi:ABC-type multidrug transport system ATPase subunit